MESPAGLLESFYLNPRNSDVQICAQLDEDQCLKIPAHKFVLASRSPVFERMFQTSEFLEGQSGLVNIKIAGGEDVARCFIKYFYFGNVHNLSLTRAISVLRTAHLYQVMPLVTSCEEVIIASLEPNNVCEIYEELKPVASAVLLDSALALMSRCGFIIFPRQHHLVLSNENLETMLQSDLLNLISEKQAADGLWQWGIWKCLSAQVEATEKNVEEMVKDQAPVVRWNNVQSDSSETQPWKGLSERFVDKLHVARTPLNTPSIMKFANSLDLFKFSQTFYYRDLKCKETENTLLKFSTNKDAYLIGLELDFTIESTIIDRIPSSLELKVDDRILSLTNAKQATLGVEMSDRLKFWSYRFTLELDKPFLLQKLVSHVFTLKTLCEENRVHMPRYEIGRGVVPNPKKTPSKDDVFFIIHEKIFSVMKLYFLPSLA